MPSPAQRRRAHSSDGPKLKRLLIRPGAIGDVIVSLPVLEWADPSEVWVPAAVVPLIRFAPKVRALSSTGIDLLEFGDDSARRHLAAFDRIDSWYGASRPEFRDAVRDLPFFFHTALPDGSCHATDFYARQLGAPEGLVARIPATRRPSGFIACHPFSGSPRKNWPLERFLDLRRSLSIHFCHSPEQPPPDAESVCFPGLGDLADWLSTASAYLGNDSGVTHLAAALGIPTVALFGPTNPEVWTPRGEHVTVLRQDETTEYTLMHALSAAVDGLDARDRSEQPVWPDHRP